MKEKNKNRKFILNEINCLRNEYKHYKQTGTLNSFHKKLNQLYEELFAIDLTKSNEDFIECPHCKENKKYNECKKLIDFNKSIFIKPDDTFIDWACDNCINERDVLLAKKDDQNIIGIGYPHFIYSDKINNCSICNEEFLFSKEEQRFWYEELKLFFRTKAKSCKDCRKKLRKQKEKNSRIQFLNNNIEILDLSQFKELIKLYIEINNLNKANYILSVARKKNKTNDENNLILKDLKSLIINSNKLCFIRI